MRVLIVAAISLAILAGCSSNESKPAETPSGPVLHLEGEDVSEAEYRETIRSLIQDKPEAEIAAMCAQMALYNFASEYATNILESGYAVTQTPDPNEPPDSPTATADEARALEIVGEECDRAGQ